MKDKKLEELTKEIAEFEDHVISELFVFVHNEMVRREAKKTILRLVDEQK